MEDEKLAKLLSELGNPTRLKIFRLLTQAGESGLCVGNIQKQLNIPNSTLSHHIFKLVSSELLEQTRQGRTLYCKANYKLLDQILSEFKKKCCIGLEDLDKSLC